MSEGSDIWEQRQRLRRHDDGPEELTTATEVLTEEDEPEVLTATAEVSAEKGEYTMSLNERLQRRRRWCVYGIRVLMTTVVA